MKKVNEYKNEKNIYNVYEYGETTVIEIVDIATGTSKRKQFRYNQIATDYLMYKMCNS